MDSKKKGRNHVDIFSNYGLDERQRSANYNIGFRCFRELYLLTMILTGVWYIVSCVTDVTIPTVVTAGSYLAAAIICYCIYALRAAKAGVINGITAFSFSTGSLVTAIFCAVLAAVFGLGAAGQLAASDKMTNSLTLAIICAMLSAEHFVLYFCGIKNNKVLDEQNSEEDEE